MSYPETILQRRFVKWLKDNAGYDERFGDPASNTSVDSVGFIKSHPVLIEFKDKLHGGAVRHEDQSAGSIEQKIRSALVSLYYLQDKIGGVLANWDRTSLPWVMVVANSFSSLAVKRLTEMLLQRAKEWIFGYTVFQWAGDSAETREELPPGHVWNNRPETIIFPDMKYVSRPRSKPPSLDEFHKMADNKGVSQPFAAMLSEAKKHRGIVQCYAGNVNIAFPALSIGKRLTAIGLWVSHSTMAQGLLVSYDIPALVQCFNLDPSVTSRLPGAEAPVVSYLSGHRYLQNTDEVQVFWRNIAGAA